MSARVTLAKTAGFCFGVDRAMSLCSELLARGEKIATLGPIIHNERVVHELEQRGALKVSAPGEVPPGYKLVIRSHGVGREVYEQCAALGIAVVDATCPFVAKIQRIVAENSGPNKLVLIAGDAGHPEVQGLVGHSRGNVTVFSGLEELKSAKIDNNVFEQIIMVAQTTFNLLKYKMCVSYCLENYDNFVSYDTVCSATRDRQTQAAELAKENDVCIVIGDTHSSNTKKLCDVCAVSAPTYLVESAADIKREMFTTANSVGVTAGASTPAPIIEEVLTRMSQVLDNDTEKVVTTNQNDDEDLDFAQAFEQYLNRASRNQRYVGIVTSVNPNEVVVDIGTKQTGIVPADEMTDEPGAKLEDIVKKGDELNLVAIKVNDLDGIVTLSKKRLDAIDGFSYVSDACTSGEVIEGVATEKVNAGLIVYVKGVRVFVHESQTTLHKGEDYDCLLKQPVKLIITDVRGPHSVRGSIRRVLLAERDEKRDEFWNTVEEGKVYNGTVKSLTSYGAFVDLGGVDGMIHISELSWGRIKHPSEVVKVGDSVEVYVKSIDRDNRKISLGYKKEEDNPWNKLKLVPLGTVFTAPVVSLVKYGAFVRIMPGVDGFIHISQISSERIEKPSDVLSIGQTVEAKLIGIDFDRQRISLSLRDDAEVPESAE